MTTNKVEIKMYVEYNKGMGLVFSKPDTVGSLGDDALSFTGTFARNQWITYVIDYTDCSVKDEIDVTTWGNGDSASFYIAYVREVQ